MMLGHERLRAWEPWHELALGVYRSTERWPIHERYGLTSQIRRATVSAATNIAEGAGKRGVRECRRYLDIALESLAETSYLLRLARDLGILSVGDWQTLDELRRRAGGLRPLRPLTHALAPRPDPSAPRGLPGTDRTPVRSLCSRRTRGPRSRAGRRIAAAARS